MKTIQTLRDDVKTYIETADEKVVMMIHAMLEVNALDSNQSDWEDNLPDEVKVQISESLAQSEKGELISHEEVKAKYPQWFTK